VAGTRYAADAGPHAASMRAAATRPASPARPSSSGGWLTSSDSISHGRFAPGAILDGRYRIIGLLGKGGMGEVYRADDLRLGQPVALKFLPDAVGSDAVRLAQFHNEVRTARQVSHPNICRVYDIGEIEGHLFLSMELVDGEDLASSLRRIGRFPEDKATDIARQLCAGLAAAHERGVLHRDLKPANVMLDGTGKVRLMDFGLAAVGTVEDIRAGTPAYMAPEQLLGREVTARSDIYALGLVLYELFTGRRAFNASTLNELIEQHQSGQLTPPTSIVSGLDPAIERAITRCLDREPARRPSSALAVAAALPGGDPLAAALAAGETPSPEMVAAAGEGAGLSRRVAIPLFIAVLVGITGVYALSLRNSVIDRLHPELNADVLAQKAREAFRQIGYDERAVDEAYGFDFNTELLGYLRNNEQSIDGSLRPSPLLFWYRRSQSPMIGWVFHHDLLTPGIVTVDDPPPIESGMMQLKLDQHGLLTSFEAMAPQVRQATTGAATLDWQPLFALAGLDMAALKPAEPQWNPMGAADVRTAWTGTWPGSTRELRVEAAALDGKPVAFQVNGPWSQPWRNPSPNTGRDIALVMILFLLVCAVVLGGALLARKNLREGRGDRAGALALAQAIVVVLVVLWICQVHVSATIGMIAPFLLTIVTTTFYGVLFWSLYLALEPFVRRHWPQTLVSWTTLLGGRVRDPIVGRDVLVGAAFGVAVALLIGVTTLVSSETALGATDTLLGMRATVGRIAAQTIYAVRTALFVFFLLFLLRVVLRNQWAAALALAAIFAAIDALDSRSALLEGTTSFVYFLILTFAVLRWGFTTLTVAVLVTELLLLSPVTSDPWSWYSAQTMLMLGTVLVAVAWAFYTSIGRRLVQTEQFH
jgi:hypothetical protein